MTEIRAGTGYDVHAFSQDRPLVLGGVRLPYALGLVGHSDADVLTHSIIDALLGAAGLGDIGDWFPPEDPRFRGMSSLTFLDTVRRALDDRGWRISNVDATVIAQEPRLAERRGEMKRTLAATLGIDEARVSIKATTPDHLGAIGRVEGIAAQAVVLIQSTPDTQGAAQA